MFVFRDDLQVPSSPYFPAYAQAQGPPPMMQERFQSVISQLFQHVKTLSCCFIHAGFLLDELREVLILVL